MDITSEPLEPRQVKLTIVVPEARRERARHAVAQALARRERFPGFRPGHVPLEQVVARFGAEAVEEAALERLGTEIVREAVRQEGLEPGAPARVALKEESPLTFEAIVPLAPEVVLGDYAALSVAAPEIAPVTDEDVAAVLEGWRGELAVLEPVAGPAAAGDVVTVAVLGMLDGEGVIDETYQLALDPDEVPERTLPPAAVAALVGAAAGETRQAEVAFSEFWHDRRLGGRDVALEMTVRAVARRSLPALDDAFAAQIAPGTTLEDIRARLRARIAADRADAARDEHVGRAIEALVGQATVRYPPALLEAETLDMVADLRANVERGGMGWDAWLELQRENEERILDELESRAKMRLERSLVLQRFAAAEGLDVPREQVDAVVKAVTRALPRGGGKGRRPADMRRDVANRMLTDRVMERLLALVGPEPAAAAE